MSRQRKAGGFFVQFCTGYDRRPRRFSRAKLASKASSSAPFFLQQEIP
jgi:hypothetical protein